MTVWSGLFWAQMWSLGRVRLPPGSLTGSTGALCGPGILSSGVVDFCLWRARLYLFRPWKSPWSVLPSVWSGDTALDPCDELNVAVPSQIPLTSNFLQMARFHAFLRLYNIPLGIHDISFIHSSVDGHSACSPVLGFVSSVALNTGVRVSFQITVFEFFGDTPGVELLGVVCELQRLGF